MIKCVILDCDGLMFDTERVSKENWLAFGQEHGFAFDDAFFRGITGVGAFEAQNQFDRFPGLEKHLDQLRVTRHNKIMELAHTSGLSKPGLENLLSYLNANDYKVCIGSSSPKDYVYELVSTLSKNYHFDFICCGDMIARRKPFPDIFLRCIQEANVKSEECLVLEDSKMGIIAASSANAIAGFIPDLISKDDEFTHLIDHEFTDLNQVITFLESQKHMDPALD
ncbi:MAG: HAD family phosphatase [Erysipelotrichaceae bacterium]|nr:HAD family phosphatase [Erysipelotrichaceae bacterium]MDY5252495.1 HAD family phosphatase [Erysipelotrichaceae bacterium]